MTRSALFGEYPDRGKLDYVALQQTAMKLVQRYVIARKQVLETFCVNSGFRPMSPFVFNHFYVTDDGGLSALTTKKFQASVTKMNFSSK